MRHGFQLQLRSARMALVLQTGDASVRDATRNDPLELLQVRGRVQGESMRGDSAGDVHANGGDLALTVFRSHSHAPCPDASAPAHALRKNPVLRADPYENLLQSAYEIDCAQARREAAEIKDGIAHKLPRTVVGDVASPPGLDHLYTPRLEQCLRGDDVLAQRISPERQNRGVFEQQQNIAHLSRLAKRDKMLLQPESDSIFNPTEIGDRDNHLRTKCVIASPSSVAVQRRLCSAFPLAQATRKSDSLLAGASPDAMKCILAIVLGFALVPAFGVAQTALYAEFGAAKLSGVSSDWIYGPTFGIYFDRWHVPFVSAGLDLRGSIQGPSSTTKLYSGLAGPRVALRPHVIPLQPYVEALVGVGHAEFGRAAAQTTQTNFEYQFLGGVDVTILPRIDWRVAEFSYGGLSGLDRSFHPKTIATGLVLRLP